MGASLNEQPTIRVVIGPLLPIAPAALELDDFADVLEGQVERRLPKLVEEVSGFCLVACGGRQLVMNRRRWRSWCSAPASPSPTKCR
jgi:hypothetical protein